MTYSILDQHEKIGWDVDGTMYEDRLARTAATDARCIAMHKYILAHPEKKHFVVTFRSGAWARRVFEDLKKINPDAPDARHFVQILCLTEQEFDENGPKMRDPSRPTDFYKNFKGRVCAANGITVLVDDNPDHVLPGCDRYGVLHLHAEHL